MPQKNSGGAHHFRFRFLDLCIRFGKIISKVCEGFNSGGIVDKVTHEPDGDYHIIIRPQYLPLPVLVTEAIPEIKDLPLPKEGDHIKIWGIVRFDEPHNWWELHPVIGWETIK